MHAGDFPERKQVHRTSSIEEYRGYLDQRWQDGCHNATQLWREMRDLGFPGMGSIVRHWIQQHYGRKNRSHHEPIPPRPPRVSPRQTAWQILKARESTKAYRDELSRRSLDIAISAELAREFFRIMQKRDVSAWAKWRESALHSPLSSLVMTMALTMAACGVRAQQSSAGAPQSEVGVQPGRLVMTKDHTTVVLEPYAPNIIRVSVSTLKAYALASPGYVIIAKPNAAGWRYEQTAQGETYRSPQISGEDLRRRP